MPQTVLSVEDINELYTDNQKCAETAGLFYSSDDLPGYERRRHGKGFRFFDDQHKALTDKKIREQIDKLVIPPAWQEVWICPDPDGHILATGVDDKGRKQYIYHPKWRKIRDLLNFYRLMMFGEQLPGIRKHVEKQLRRRTFDREQALALMLWVLDNGYIRIGNDAYYEENDSVGLTTLTKKHVQVKGSVVSLAFIGKSHQEQTIELDDALVATLFRKLLALPGQRLFKISASETLDAEACNQYLRELASGDISAKNFRTWGGTLAAFKYLKSHLGSPRKNDQLVVKAVDKAAETLGNTRAVAKKHYVHPHILETFTRDTFGDYYKIIKKKRVAYLEPDEAELLAFLEVLFQKEFDLLQLTKRP